MEVTSIRMNLLNNAGGIKAIGSFSLDDAFAIRGIRVMEDRKDLMEIMRILHSP